MKIIEVMQGNKNAKSIDFNSDSYLVTHNLVPCIALLIADNAQQKYHMIHCDSIGNIDIGGTTLKTVFIKLALSENRDYLIGLIGGASDASLEKMKQTISTLLPKAKTIIIEKEGRSAYLSGQGVMASSKEELGLHSFGLRW